MATINRSEFYVQVDNVRRLGTDEEWENHLSFLERGVEHMKMSMRSYRDAYLKDSDWVVPYYMERGETIPQNWKDYRQALRDVPSQPGYPDEIEWPVKPE